jgi:hypothetical protein
MERLGVDAAHDTVLRASGILGVFVLGKSDTTCHSADKPVRPSGIFYFEGILDMALILKLIVLWARRFAAMVLTVRQVLSRCLSSNAI